VLGRWSVGYELGLACHNALSRSLTYLDLLATGHSINLGEEVELCMTGENDKTKLLEFWK
jgi:hypothetical protein